MSEFKERPILFSAPMVRAILVGRKTQTRRVVKLLEPPPDPLSFLEQCWHVPAGMVWANSLGAHVTCRAAAKNPYGKTGDRLWVREAWAKAYDPDYGDLVEYVYRADGERKGWTWKPSIHMPRCASRIALEITDVRVQRLQDISAADARAEGRSLIQDNPVGYFPETWDSINAKRGFGWESNPWIWALTFRRVA